MRGTAPDGRPYAASDPHLLRWVHVTEAESFLTAFQRYSDEPLTAAEADRYVEQAAVVARRLGVVDPPTTVRAAGRRDRGLPARAGGTPAAREAARFLLVHPPLPLAARPGYVALAVGAVALLPRWARTPLRLPSLPVTDRFVGRPLGAAATSVVRWAMRHPDDVRNRAEAAAG